MVVLLVTLMLDFIILAIAVLLLSFFFTMNDFSLKSIFTKQFFHEWFISIKEVCIPPNFIVIISVLLFIILLPMAYDANERAISQKNNICICNCKRCKDVSHKVDAMMKYLALDDEDVNDILTSEKKED